MRGEREFAEFCLRFWYASFVDLGSVIFFRPSDSFIPCFHFVLFGKAVHHAVLLLLVFV